MKRYLVFGFCLVAMASTAAAESSDVRAGKRMFARTCENCHSTKIGVNEIGPTLWNVVGRAPASVPGFSYSDAMKAISTPWTAEAIEAYLSNPRAEIHGAKMWFKGISSAKVRHDVVAYLKTLR